MPAARKKPSKKQAVHVLRQKPQTVYTVQKKPTASKAPPKKKQQKQHRWLNAPFNKSTYLQKTGRGSAFVIIVVVLVVAATWVNAAARGFWHEQKRADRASSRLQEDSSAWTMLRLVGSPSYYPKEIQNYSSAPADLQAFALKDYRKFKASCISNGKLITPLNYQISNVVYDSFARISKECGGTDMSIVVKMSNKWTVVFEGNDLPTCDSVNEYQIPQGISSQCVKNLVVYTNPNP